MSVTVMLELTVTVEYLSNIVPLLLGLRNRASASPGNKGEATWRVVDTPNLFFIVTQWDQLNNWLGFIRLPETRAALQDLSPFLVQPPTTRFLQELEVH